MMLKRPVLNMPNG